MIARHIEYVVFDVETTGLNPQNGDRIIELAAVRVRDGKTLDTFHSFIHPQRDIPEEVQRIHGISEEMVADAPAADVVLPRMIDFIAGGCLVAHNIKFDLDFLCYQLAMIGRKLNDATPAVDTLKLAKHFLPQLSSYQLANLAQYFGVRVGETHRALADVELTVAVLNHLLILAEGQGKVKFAEVVKLFSVNKPSFKIQESAQTVLF